MNRFNSQLPEVNLPENKVNWFSRHYLWGYAFIVLSFLLAIAFIYQVEYGKRERKSQGMFCAQVIVPAKNPQTGEIKDFPTPCDVPKNWQAIDPSSQEGNDLNL